MRALYSRKLAPAAVTLPCPRCAARPPTGSDLFFDAGDRRLPGFANWLCLVLFWLVRRGLPQGSTFDGTRVSAAQPVLSAGSPSGRLRPSAFAKLGLFLAFFCSGRSATPTMADSRHQSAGRAGSIFLHDASALRRVYAGRFF